MTALDFDLDPIDEAVLELLNTITNLDVHVGSVGDSDMDEKTVSAPLPYALFGSTLGYSTSPRLGGHRDRSVPFTVTSTHDSLRGTKAVALAVRGLLDGASVEVVGVGRRLIHLESDRQVYIDRDTVWTRPGGLPLFFAVDRFHVSI